jgi:hypothetical protein
MKKQVLYTALCAAALGYSSISQADDRVVRFDGGIGETPVSNPDARNIVRNVPPGGQPWVISRLTADVRSDGRISVDGRGLLLAGGNNIGTNGGQSVRAVLFCNGADPVNSDLVPLEANGDFRIEGVLSATPANPCNSPVLLIVSGAGSWFAAGIPKP